MTICPLCFCLVLTVWLFTLILDSSTSRLTWDDLVDSKGSPCPSRSHASYQTPAPNPVTTVLYWLACLPSSSSFASLLIFILFIITCCILASYISYQVEWLIFFYNFNISIFFSFHLYQKSLFWYNLKKTFAILMEILNAWK